MIANSPTPAASPATSSATSPDDRVGHLDGWRGLAILLVLQSHFLPLRGFDTGQLGVDIFFSLSGLLMSNLLFVRRVRLTDFYKRRISRILPAFVLFVFVIHGSATIAGVAWDWDEFFWTLLFMRTYLPDHPDIWNSSLPVGHLWSLNVEEHCYVVLSLLAGFSILRSREVWILAVMSILAMGLYYVYEVSPPDSSSSFEVRTEIASSFLLVSAGYYLVRHRVAKMVRPWMPLAALAISLCAYIEHSHWWTSAIIAPIALSFCVNHLAQSPPAVLRALASRPLRHLGIWSYSIYLWQQPFFQMKASLPLGSALLLAMLAGLTSFYVVETPLRSWINARW